MTRLIPIICAVLLCCGAEFSAQPPTQVVVVGIDGLNNFRFEDAVTPHFDQLKTTGSWTLTAQCNLPSSSSPNWSSILRGTTPDHHMNKANGFKQKGYKQNPTCPSAPNYFPTIFTLIREQHKKAKVGLFQQWIGMQWLLRGDRFNRKKWRPFHADKLVNKAMRFYTRKDPELVFIHIDDMDHVGHSAGHESDEYATELEKVDKLLGQVVETIERKDQFEHTYLLVVTDHGGTGTGHGGNSEKEMNIPWMVRGPGIKAGHAIQSPVKNEDTALMIAHFLDLSIHKCWTGKVIEEVLIP